MKRKLAALAALLVMLQVSVFAQDIKPTESESEKEKKQKEIDAKVIQILDQLVSGADLLRLPQNRALIFGVVGDLYWKYDDKRARELFKNVGNELNAFNLEAETERRERNASLMEDAFAMVSSGTRNDVLPLVAKHDAELALELLVQTRPAKLVEAIARASVPSNRTPDMMNYDPDRQRVRQELALEQQFALAAADASPEKAIKLIKESLARGISPNVIQLLEKLHKKDSKKAAELAGDVIKKVVDSDLSKLDEDMRAAMSLLQFAFKQKPAGGEGKEKLFSFSSIQVKDLANKVATTLLQPSRSMMVAVSLSEAMPILEKLLPEKAAALRQRLSDYETTMPPELKRIQEQQALWDENATIEDILARLPKLTNEFEKMAAYSAITNKIDEVEDEAKAKKIIEQIPDEKARNAAIEQFEAGRIGRSAKDGKLDEAKKLISNLKKRSTQIQRLVSLALQYQKKGGEKDVASAKGLMKDARAMINENAETSDQMNDLMEVVRGYTKVDSDMAFKLFEPTIGRMNELLDATAVLSTYEPNHGSFKKGEIAMTVTPETWSLIIFKFIPHIQALAKADLDRMNALAGRFARDDVRTLVRLYAIQGFLKDEKDGDIPSRANFIFAY